MKCRFCHKHKRYFLLTKDGKLICSFCHNRRMRRRKRRNGNRVNKTQGSTTNRT